MLSAIGAIEARSIDFPVDIARYRSTQILCEMHSFASWEYK